MSDEVSIVSTSRCPGDLKVAVQYNTEENKNALGSGAETGE